MRRIAFLSALGISLILSACKDRPQSRATAEDVAARVNGVEITLSDVDRLVEQQLRTAAQQGQAPPTPAELAAARLQVLEGLITQEALYQKAERLGLLPTEEEIIQGIQQFKRERGLSEEGFHRTLRELGQTEEQFRREIRRQLAIRKLLDREVTPRITVTDREIEDFYKANKAQFVERRGFVLARILVTPERDNVPDDAVGADAAERKIREIYDQLRRGADFATVAARRSEDPLTAARGGNWGFFPETAEQFPETVRARLLTMRDGDITEPIRIGNTWLILKLVRRIQRDRELGLDEVRAQIAEELRDQREQVLQTAVTRLALAESRIENVLARRMLENPTTFGGLRPIALPTPPPPSR
jgi:peptidyl-prolyl cis-trans isomerase SurA